MSAFFEYFLPVIICGLIYSIKVDKKYAAAVLPLDHRLLKRLNHLAYFLLVCLLFYVTCCHVTLLFDQLNCNADTSQYACCSSGQQCILRDEMPAASV